MSHDIESDFFFCVGEKAWHNIGKVLSAAPSIIEAHNLTGGFEVVEMENYAGPETPTSDPSDYADTGYKSIVRNDGKVLSVMKQRYEIIQPKELWENFEVFLDTGLCEIETGGILANGRKMFGTLKIKDAVREVIKGDEIRANILSLHSFDGSCNLEIRDCNTRVVCANTLACAQMEGSKHLFKIRHTKNMRNKIEDAKQHILNVLDNLDKQMVIYKALAVKKMKSEDQEKYINEVFEYDPDNEELSTRLENKVHYVIDLLEGQKGLELVPAVRGTAWQAYNAVSQYCTHDIGNYESTRLEANLFGGEAQRLNKRALDLAIAWN